MMSSQFSYELDERQIRLMMQDAELDYNEALWNKFDSMSVLESKSSSIGNFLPSFNISISRSVIVPVLFVILIGGLSAMLFSFVDFRKKEQIDKETPLVANPDNFKKSEITPEKIVKPITKAEIANASIDTSAKVISTPSVTLNEPTISLTSDVKKEDTIKPAAEKPKEEITPTVEVKKESLHKPVKNKKSRKVRPEVLPIINATTNLNEGVSEPELDLK